VKAFIGPGEYSESAKAFMGAFYLTLRRYVPRRYNGRVLLYKCRLEPLLYLNEVDRKWKKIADNVEVVPVGGTHVMVMYEANVKPLAIHLDERLRECRAQILSDAERVEMERELREIAANEPTGQGLAAV
jgi:hypothetical protein